MSTRARTSRAPTDSLEEAQERKLELICRKLRLQPGERFLDIGCGWGSLVLHAAEHHGVRALGVTLSEPQAELARRRVAAAGLEDRVEVRVLDYRELREEPFDKIASVGMYEHVGRAQLDTYVDAVHRMLKPGGLFLNHGITRIHTKAPRGPTFISRYVFPDGELHPVTEIIGALEAGGFEIRDVESLREHYALTLRRWVANLAAGREAAIAEIGDGARARLAALHARLGAGLRRRRDRHLPDARGARRRRPRAAARSRRTARLRPGQLQSNVICFISVTASAIPPASSRPEPELLAPPNGAI